MTSPLKANLDGEKYWIQLNQTGRVFNTTRSPVNARMGIVSMVAMVEFWLILLEIELTMKPRPAPLKLTSISIKYISPKLKIPLLYPTNQKTMQS